MRPPTNESYHGRSEASDLREYGGVPKSKVGSVVSLWRYPVKSMMGEELDTADLTDRGLLGDRAYALMDSDGKVASAKSSRTWARLLGFRAALMEPPHAGEKIPPVRITLPDGMTVGDEQSLKLSGAGEPSESAAHDDDPQPALRVAPRVHPGVHVQ